MKNPRIHSPIGLVTSAALLTILASATACAPPEPPSSLSRAESAAIADSLEGMVRDAYDLSRGNVVERMMSLYPDTGRVVSATAGRTTTSRDSLELAVKAFWEGVGKFMVGPKWTWNAIEVDVLDRDAAVMTAQIQAFTSIVDQLGYVIHEYEKRADTYAH